MVWLVYIINMRTFIINILNFNFNFKEKITEKTVYTTIDNLERLRPSTSCLL